jgi:hypothetical protein
MPHADCVDYVPWQRAKSFADECVMSLIEPSGVSDLIPIVEHDTSVFPDVAAGNGEVASRSEGQQAVVHPTPVAERQAADTLRQDNRCQPPWESPAVRIRFEVTDLEGRPLAQIQPGNEFLVNIFVEDLRPQPQGVFAAYLDMSYDKELVSVVGTEASDLRFGTSYPNGKSGVVRAPGELDEVGAFSSMTPLEDGEYLLVRIRMSADRPGTAELKANAADEPGYDVLVYGENEPVPQHAVEFVSTNVVIAP